MTAIGVGPITEIRPMATHAHEPAPSSNGIHPWDVTRECIGPHLREISRALGLSQHTVAKWRLEPSREPGDGCYGIRGPVERTLIMVTKSLELGRAPVLATSPVRYMHREVVEQTVAAAASALRLVAELDQSSGTLSALIALAYDDGVVDAAEFRLVNEALDRHEAALRTARATVRAA